MIGKHENGASSDHRKWNERSNPSRAEACYPMGQMPAPGTGGKPRPHSEQIGPLRRHESNADGARPRVCRDDIGNGCDGQFGKCSTDCYSTGANARASATTNGHPEGIELRSIEW
jgi:hypothetical protein